MKKISFLAVFFLSVSAYSKEIHSPFWYSISEKIISGTHQLINSEEAPAKPAAKIKVVKKARPIAMPLKCEQKDTVTPTPFFTIKSNGIWIDSK